MKGIEKIKKQKQTKNPTLSRVAHLGNTIS